MFPVIFVQPSQVKFDLPHIRRAECSEFQIDYDEATEETMIEDQIDIEIPFQRIIEVYLIKKV